VLPNKVKETRTLQRHYIVNGLECPRCKCISIPLIREGITNAVACQNPECRIVVDRNNSKIGRWMKEYKKLVLDKRSHKIN